MSEIMSDDDKTVIMASWLPVVVHFYVITVWSEKASFCQGSRSRTIYSTYKLLMRDLQVHMKYKLKLHIHMNQPTSDELFNLLKWMIIILWGSKSGTKYSAFPMRDLQVHMKYKLKFHIHMNQPTSDELFSLLKCMIGFV